ncbi:MAG: fatty acid desaturase [Saprospiraceae bacterium]|nr:fatty acid desaturase [Saprospiraceae bacterium]
MTISPSNEQDDREIKEALKDWQKIVSQYGRPDKKKAIVQIFNTFLPFVGLWVLMYVSLSWSYWITLGLAVVNAFFLVRIFIIQHDCGHQSFLKKRKLNDAIGLVCSFFSAIPYKYWSRSHNFHHAHNGQLEVRDIGDIHMLTVNEYRDLPYMKRLAYKLFRNPVVLFVLGPIYYILINVRFPLIDLKGWKNVKKAQFFNNVYLILVYALVAFIVGWKQFFLVHIPIVVLFAIIAVWFFYVQHQHEETYKQWKDNWEYLLSAVKGSTYYKLPKMVQWLTGNIGLHHIHHLNPKIPNYHLTKCAIEHPVLTKYVTTVGFWESLKCMFNHLWDEDNQRMISFWEFRKMERAAA